MPGKAALISRFEEWQSLGFDAARCPVRDVLDHIGDKWTTLILIGLNSKVIKMAARARLSTDAK